MLASIIAGLGLGLLISLSVGPVIFMIIKYSVSAGLKAGLSFVLGVSVSDLMYVILGLFASAFVHRLEGLEQTIGIAGGGVLIIIGLYGLFFKHLNFISRKRKSDQTVVATRGHYFRIWLSGFLMNALNPGVIILWFGFITANSSIGLERQVVMFGTTLLFILSADITKVFLAGKIRKKLTLRTVNILNKVVSLGMVVFGVLLIYLAIFQADRLKRMEHAQFQSKYTEFISYKGDNLPKNCSICSNISLNQGIQPVIFSTALGPKNCILS